MKQIALVSYAGCPDLTDDDRLLLPALRHLGVEATCAVWDAPVDWTQFDQVVLRSCWDYHLRHNEFLDWVGRIEQSFVLLQNVSHTDPLERKQTVPAPIGSSGCIHSPDCLD